MQLNCTQKKVKLAFARSTFGNSTLFTTDAYLSRLFDSANLQLMGDILLNLKQPIAEGRNIHGYVPILGDHLASSQIRDPFVAKAARINLDSLRSRREICNEEHSLAFARSR